MIKCALIELCVSSRTQGEPGSNRHGANDWCLMKVRKSQDGKRVLGGKLRATAVNHLAVEREIVLEPTDPMSHHSSATH